MQSAKIQHPEELEAALKMDIDFWECHNCTFRNIIFDDMCEMCESIKPSLKVSTPIKKITLEESEGETTKESIKIDRSSSSIQQKKFAEENKKINVTKQNVESDHNTKKQKSQTSINKIKTQETLIKEQQTKKQIEKTKQTIPSSTGIRQCSACTVQIGSADICYMCGETASDIKHDLYQQIYIKCPSCAEKNHAYNELCVFCDESLFGDKLPRPVTPLKTYKPGTPKPLAAPVHSQYKNCVHCGKSMMEYQIVNHQKFCSKIGQAQIDQLYKKVMQKQCVFCGTKFGNNQSYEAHNYDCHSRSGVFNKQNDTFLRCTQQQFAVMKYMHAKSEKYHWIAKDMLMDRLYQLGMFMSDLTNLANYVANYAPVIIHFHVNKHMGYFTNDTNYRNQFETGNSSGSKCLSSRRSWQERLFDSQYSSGIDHTHRVKYGTINLTNDRKGVKACRNYGKSYFLLRQSVRNRCTLTDKDSSSPVSLIGTLPYHYHVLNQLTDNELLAVIKASKGENVDSAVVLGYKQIQIHGPVQFEKDVQKIYIDLSDLDDASHLDHVEEFCLYNNIEYEIFEK